MRVAEAFFIQRAVPTARPAAGGAVFRLPVLHTAAAAAGAAVQACRTPAAELVRRRASLRAGRGLVETLEALKLALLQGQVGAGEIETLRRQLETAADQTSGDAALDEIIEAVRLRAEVEIAKRGMWR